jgi:hypothetical protein
LLGGSVGRAGAQRPVPDPRPPDSLRAGISADVLVRQRARLDSLRPPLSPGRAFLYSFLVPGLGQARLERHAAGAIYATIEAVAIAMAVKSANELRISKGHVRDSIVAGYQTDADGAPILDAQGNFIPVIDTTRNRNTANRVRARRTHVEDWFAALAFNHLFSGADAFVAAQLWDLPARVGFRATRSGPAVGVTIRW